MSIKCRYNENIYGPVNSRRLGRSLGINLIGWDNKICTMNCKYCERGWTDFYNEYNIDKYNLPHVSDICESLEEILDNIQVKPDFLTFSGNGEPTLHPQFPEFVDEIVRIRNKKSPLSKIAILTNSTTLDKPGIVNSINKLDEKIMKLDAGNEETFKLFNAPMCKISLEDIIIGIMKIENTTIQSLFADGKEGNYTNQNLYDWIEKLKYIKPKKVQVYTLDRGYPSENIFPLGIKELKYIGSMLESINIKVDVIY
jgi:wyosine [tRNA(Phe)-imidazoG37] synthetase (radical SAM superfamily)